MDILGDSQSSEEDLTHLDAFKWKDNTYDREDDISFSDSSDSSSNNDDSRDHAHDILEGKVSNPLEPAVDQILKRVKKSSDELALKRNDMLSKKDDTDSVGSKSKDKNHITIARFNLGDSFDSKVIEKLNQLNKVKDIINTNNNNNDNNSTHENSNKSILSIDDSKESINELKKQYKLKLSKNNITLDPDTIDMICHDKTGRYKDWYFITNNGQEQLVTNSLKEFLLSIGVDESMLYDDFYINDGLLNQLDPYCIIFEPDYILEEFSNLLEHVDGSKYNDNYFKWWLYLILDKTIYNSLLCNIFWCNDILNIFLKRYGTLQNLVKLYWKFIQLNENKYYLLYRLTRLLPKLKPYFVVDIFQNDQTLLINQFDSLYDSQNFKDLLYFILFIHGSEMYPIGIDTSITNNDVEGDDILENDSIDNKALGNNNVKNDQYSPQSIIQYFKDCIIDASSDQQCAREIPIILSILKLFSFQS